MIQEPTSYSEVKEQYYMFRDMYSMLMPQFYHCILSFDECKGVVLFSDKVSYIQLRDILVCRKRTRINNLQYCNYSFYINSGAIVRLFDASRVSRFANKLFQHRDFGQIATLNAGSNTLHIGSVGFSCEKENIHLELLKIMIENCFVQQNGYMPSIAVRLPNKFMTAYDPEKVVAQSIDGGPIPFSGEEVMEYLSDEQSDSYFNLTLSTSLTDQLKMAMLTMPGWTSDVLTFIKEHNIRFSSILELVAMMNMPICNTYIMKMRDVNKELRLFNEQQNRYGNTASF